MKSNSRAFASGTVFPRDVNSAFDLSDNITIDMILTKAIKMELESIAFYQGIKDSMSKELGKDKVEAIIREERQHVITLSEKLASLLSFKEATT